MTIMLLTQISLVCVFAAGCAESSNGLPDAATNNGADSKPGDPDAAPGTPDAPVSQPDAAVAAAPLGKECTGAGQGTCPAGYECLNLVGGSGSWCSKQCTMGAGDTCDQGYTGPGVGSCILTVTPQGGAPAQYCTIICQDEPGAPTLCAPGTRCTGTCPTPLMCKGMITLNGGGTAGKTCE